MSTFYTDTAKICKQAGIALASHHGAPAAISSLRRGISVSAGLSLEEQRYAIAFALSHFTLERLDDNNKIKDFKRNYSRKDLGLEEDDANDFATELLMPKTKMEYILNEKGISKVDEFAEIFVVPEAAAVYRLQTLGWIS